MNIKTIEELEAFKKAINACNGRVYLRSLEGDIYNLKSALTQYIALGKLLGEHGEELELFCDQKEDEANFLAFFGNHAEVV